jgi:putative restriction endonuclease
MKLVLDTKPNSGYRDELARRYHFPSQYKRLVDEAIGDWVVFRRTRAGGGHMGYIGVGQIASVEPDPETPGHYYAVITNFLDFDQVVPWRDVGRYLESPLREIPDITSIGRSLRGRSARPLDEEDFAAIVGRGLSDTLAPANARRFGLTPAETDEATRDLLAASAPEQERRIVEILVNRKIRDANFRRQVIEAYDARCAVTRLRIINGGGRAEVQAAHVWAVQHGGPDTVRNGVALSSTVHWLFDRHLISLDQEYRLLVAHNRVPSDLRALFHEHEGRIHLPADRSKWPSEEYMAKHREMYAAA